jgi:phosphoglycolate phosphatase-like HAD superfamily hydrolase
VSARVCGYVARVIRNIIFDWSGTLVDDLPAVLQASNFVLAQAGKPAMSLATFRAEFALPFKKFYDRHTPEVPMEQLEHWFHASFKEAQTSVVELPHARTFLEFCRAHKIRTFLLSTVHGDYFKTQCGVTGFDVFLDRPYTDVWDKREKIHEILRENNLRADETLFIGDMEHDIATAKHGGIHSCAVLTGYNTLEQLRAASPDLIVEHLSELRAVLEKNNFRLKPLAEQKEKHPLATVGALIFNSKKEALLIRTQNKIRRNVRRRVAPRDQRRDEPQGDRHRICAGAGLHPLQGILQGRAFCAAELHLPRHRQAGREVESRRPGIPLAETGRRKKTKAEPADENSDRRS